MHVPVQAQGHPFEPSPAVLVRTLLLAAGREPLRKWENAVVGRECDEHPTLACRRLQELQEGSQRDVEPGQGIGGLVTVGTVEVSHDVLTRE
jgi:hypothetical protein